MQQNKRIAVSDRGGGMADIRGPDYELAEKDYMLGMKYKDIGEKYNVSINTVKSWKQRYNWNRKGVHTKTEKVCIQNSDVSWIEIEKEYVTDIRKKPCSLEDLAKKYNIPIGTIKDRSKSHEWSQKRTEYILSTSQKAIEKSSEQDADRIAKLIRITDIATRKAEQSLGELETYLVKHKKKTKVVEYGDGKALGKPTKEVIFEEETLDTVEGPIDRLGLMQVTNALKNIKELYSIDLDMAKKEHEIGILKSKDNGDIDEEVEDDGFIEALKVEVSEVWDDAE